MNCLPGTEQNPVFRCSDARFPNLEAKDTIGESRDGSVFDYEWREVK